MNLEKYASEGGTLIVFSQQKGSDYSILPGGMVGGFGWNEDQSCHRNSAGMSTYHPILSGAIESILDIKIDGFFTKLPVNATILLTRVRNSMPAMILYEYGRGRVVASTLYSDLSPKLEGSADERILLRDLFTWAYNLKPIQTLSPNEEATVSVNFTNPVIFSSSWPVFSRGDMVNIPVNVTNFSNESVDMVTFTVIDPYYNYYYVNVSTFLASNETAILNLNHQTDNSSNAGIWLVLYSLYNGQRKVWGSYYGAFLLDMDLDAVSNFKVTLTLLSSNYNVFLRRREIVENKTIFLHVEPAETKSINLTFTPEVYGHVGLGIWTLNYKIETLNGIVVEAGIEQYAVSKYQENPDGWNYQAKDLSFYITTPDDHPGYFTDVPFTVHVLNRGEADRNITVLYWDDNLGKRQSWAAWECQECMSHGLCPEGCVKKNLYVPAHNESSFTFIHYLLYSLQGSAFDAYFFDENGTKVGYSIRGVWPIYIDYHRQMELEVKTDKNEYLRGDNVTIYLSIRARHYFKGKIWVAIWDTSAKYGDWLTIKGYDMFLPEFSSFNDTLTFSLPKDWKTGTYAVLVDAGIIFAEKLGWYSVIASNSTYFEVPGVHMKIVFDKTWYREGETVGIDLLVNNSLPIPLSDTLKISIPALSYSNTTPVELEPKQGTTLHFNVSLPSSIDAGSYEVIAELWNTTETSSFSVPKSKLEVYLAKNNFSNGENVILEIGNSGGVRTVYECNVTILDSFLKTISSERGTGLVRAGENASIMFKIPDGAVKGTYFLVLRLNDVNAGQHFIKYYVLNIDGLNAHLISDADKKVYFTGENVTLTTIIDNLDGIIKNATLNIQILSKEKACVVPHDDLYINEDTVLCPGFYNLGDPSADGVIIINASNVILEGNNAVLNGSYHRNFAIYNPGFDNVTIRNVAIQNFEYGIYMDNDVENIEIIGNVISGPQYQGEAAIYVESGKNITIAYNEFMNGLGMYLDFAENTKILHNHLLTSFISLWRSHLSIVMNNTVEDGSIRIERSNNCTVMYNTIISGKITISGTSYYSANHNVVARNTINGGPGNGIELFTAHYNIIAENDVTNKMQSGIYLTDSDFNIIVGNTANSNGEGGIEMEGNKFISNTLWHSWCLNNTVVGNIASFNMHGIYLIGVTKYSLIANNTLIQNSYGIFLKTIIGYFPQYNTIYHNNFLENNIQVEDPNIWPIGKNNYDDGYPSGGNYWSNYTGMDNDGDGIGDTPYVVNTATQDNYPFMNQSSWEPFNITEITEKLNVSIPIILSPEGPPREGNIIWEREIPVNVTDTLDLSTFVGQLGVTGKLYLISTLYSATGQIIASNTSTFYVTNTDVYLALETDKKVYKPDENITIGAEVGNLGNTSKTLTLIVKKDDDTIRNVSFTLNPNEKFTDTLTTTSDTSFTLDGAVDGFTVRELIRVSEPKMNLTIYAPEVVGREPFTATVEIQNTGEVELNLNVLINDQGHQITIPAGQTRQIQAELSIDKNTTLTVKISGDIEATCKSES